MRSLYTLTNGLGLKLTAITLGGIVTGLWAPDAQGQSGNVVLGATSGARSRDSRYPLRVRTSSPGRRTRTSSSRNRPARRSLFDEKPSR